LQRACHAQPRDAVTSTEKIRPPAGHVSGDRTGAVGDGAGDAGPSCGDGKRDPGEQCDDGNLVNLDGCSASCKFELTHRASSFALVHGTDATCSANALGGAMGSIALQTMNTAFASTVKSGSLGLMALFTDLGDLTGATDQTPLHVGLFSAQPTTTSGYDGTNDLDWWYAAQATTLDTNRVPTSLLTGSLASRALTVGLGHYVTPGMFTFSSLRMTATLGSASAPLLSSNAMPPGHVPAEHLDPTLTAVATTSSGTLCGNVSAASLASQPAPPQIKSVCGGYVTLLDVLVGGCGGAVGGVAATQPDAEDTTVPPVGAGGPYKLVLTASHVSSCQDHTGVVVDLTACLDRAAYSSYFTFTTDRVIVVK